MHRAHLFSKRNLFLIRITIFLLSLLITLSVAEEIFATEMPDDVYRDTRRNTEASSTKTVWIVGDSLTRGLFASTEAHTYRNLLFDALRDKHTGEIHTTFWSGVCTLAELEQRWDQYVGLPDLIFIELGINDSGRNSNCPQVPIEEWQARFGAMLDRIQQDAPGVKIIVGTIPWCGWSEDSWSFEEALIFNDWIATEAQKRDITVADLWTATLGKSDGISTPDQPSIFPPSYHGDNFHPSDLGHQRIANTFFDAYLDTLHSLYLPQVMHADHYDQS
jgi:lysophospholipase L1-like esterase